MKSEREVLMPDLLMTDLRRLDEMVRQLEDLEANLAVNWDGPTARAYLHKLRLLGEAIRTSREALYRADGAGVRT